MEDRLHEAPVVLHHRALAGDEDVRLREPEAEAHRQRALLGRFVDGTRITGDVEPGDAEAAAGPRDVHERVEHGRGCFVPGVLAVSAGLEADGVDAAVDLRGAEDLLDLVLRVALRDVDRLAAEAPRLRQTVLVEVADDGDGGTEEQRRGGRRETDGTGARDVDGRAHLHSRPDGAVESGGEDVREHREVEDLLHRLLFVRELQDVPVRVGDEDVFGLSADPAAHVDVAVGRTGTIGVDVEADSRLALLAVPTAAARDVERHRDEVADLDELDVPTDLDDLTGDLVTEDETLGSSRAAPDHVLVGAADVRGDGLEDDTVIDLPADVGGIDAGAVLEDEFRVLGVDDLDLAGTCVADCPVAHP